MFSDFAVGGVKVTNPIESNQLKINLSYKKGTLAEIQPILSFDRLVFSRDGVSQIKKMRASLGPYHQIPFNFRFADRQLFNGYLTDFNFLGELDEIEAKPVSFDSTDGLSELLSVLDLSLLKDDFNYTDLDYKIKKVDVSGEIAQLSQLTLVYGYIFYMQIKQVSDFAKDQVIATINAGPPFPSFGEIIGLIIEGIALAVFFISTLIAMIKQVNELLAILFPKKKKTKVISIHEMMRVSLDHIGYKLETDIDDLHNVCHWASGQVDQSKNKEYHPRSTDVCGNALGLFNLVLKKYAAQVAVTGKTVKIFSSYSDEFNKNKPLKIQSFPHKNFRENTDDMIGTREIIYSTDTEDKWTNEEFKGTEYIIRANIDDPKKSTIKGLEQTLYGVALCSRNEDKGALENVWGTFIKGVNAVIIAFGGANQALSIPTDVGVAKISGDRLGVAKLVYVKNKRIPRNHKDLLSAKADEDRFHYVKSHVRNPRAKTKIFESIPQNFNDSSLSCSLNGNACISPDGVAGMLNVVDWTFNKDYAELSFEIEDVNRVTKLNETFYEPLR